MLKRLLIAAIYLLGSVGPTVHAQVNTTVVNINPPAGSSIPGKVTWREVSGTDRMSLVGPTAVTGERLLTLPDKNGTVIVEELDGITRTNNLHSTYITTQKIDVKDNSGTGGSAFWDIQTHVTAGQSSFFLRDNIGSKAIEFFRVSLSNPADFADVYVDLWPNADGSQKLGAHGRRWSNIYTQAIDVSGDIIPLTNGVSNLGSELKAFAEIHVDMLSADRVGLDLIPAFYQPGEFIPGLNLGTPSLPWYSAYIRDLNVVGTCTGCTASNVVTLDTTQTVTGAKTFTATANFTNINGAPAGQTGNYIRTRKLDLVDNTGTLDTAWDLNATITAGESSMHIRDNAGNKVIQFNRLFLAAPQDYADVFVDLHPNADNSQQLGFSGRRWSSVWASTYNVSGNILPTSNDVSNLGSDLQAFNQLWVKELHADFVSDLIPLAYNPGEFIPGVYLGRSDRPFYGAYIRDITSVGTTTVNMLNVTGSCTGCGGTTLANYISSDGDDTTLNHSIRLHGSGGGPRVVWRENSNPADEKAWQLYTNITDGQLVLGALNDAESVQSTPLIITRNGYAADGIALAAASAISLTSPNIYASGNLWTTNAEGTLVMTASTAPTNNQRTRFTTDTSGSTHFQVVDDAFSVANSAWYITRAGQTVTSMGIVTDLVPAVNLAYNLGSSSLSWNIITAAQSQLSDATALIFKGAGLKYQASESTHLAHYKKSGAHSFYWRKSSTGYPGAAGEASLAEIDDVGSFYMANGVYPYADATGDIGSPTQRFYTIRAYNFDGAPASATGNYISTRNLSLVDFNGGTGSWNLHANQTSSTSSMWIRDGLNNKAIEFNRALIGSAVDYADVYMDLYPNNDISQKLGSNTRRWSALWVQDIETSGDMLPFNTTSDIGAELRTFGRIYAEKSHIKASAVNFLPDWYTPGCPGFCIPGLHLGSSTLRWYGLWVRDIDAVGAITAPTANITNLTVSSCSGCSGAAPANMVTTDTPQTITSQKTFTTPVYVSSISVGSFGGTASTVIDFSKNVYANNLYNTAGNVRIDNNGVFYGGFLHVQGTTTTLSCGSGQAIKSIDVYGGIVTGVSCGAP